MPLADSVIKSGIVRNPTIVLSSIGGTARIVSAVTAGAVPVPITGISRTRHAREGTTRNPGKAQLLSEAGFDAVIEDRGNILQTDADFDRVLDLIGPAALKDTFSHTAAGGVICVTGLLGGEWTLDAFDPLEDMPANGYLTSFHSGNVCAESIQEMLNYISEHHVDVRPEKVFDLAGLADAHRYMESSRSFGKVVVMSLPPET